MTHGAHGAQVGPRMPSFCYLNPHTMNISQCNTNNYISPNSYAQYNTNNHGSPNSRNLLQISEITSVTNCRLKSHQYGFMRAGNLVYY